MSYCVSWRGQPGWAFYFSCLVRRRELLLLLHYFQRASKLWGSSSTRIGFQLISVSFISRWEILNFCRNYSSSKTPKHGQPSGLRCLGPMPRIRDRIPLHLKIQWNTSIVDNPFDLTHLCNWVQLYPLIVDYPSIVDNLALMKKSANEVSVYYPLFPATAPSSLNDARRSTSQALEFKKWGGDHPQRSSNMETNHQKNDFTIDLHAFGRYTLLFFMKFPGYPWRMGVKNERCIALRIRAHSALFMTSI